MLESAIQYFVMFLSITIFLVIISLANKKNREESGNYIIKFSSSLSTLFLIINIILLVIISVFILVKENMIIVYTVLLPLLLMSAYYYLKFKRKIIIINGNDIIFKGMFSRKYQTTFNDIKNVIAKVGNIITVYTTDNKFTIDYQMMNFQLFLDEIKKRNIEIKIKNNTEV